MKTTLSQFKRSKNHLLCIDSDGCAIDSMESKHRICFGPAILDLWPALSKDRVAHLELWNHLNLYSPTRGINRFAGLSLFFDHLKEKGLLDFDHTPLKSWIENTPSLSAPALEAVVKETKDPFLLKVLSWSQRVNERMDTLLEEPFPFQFVKETLALAHEKADLVIVSSANGSAVRSEWTAHGLSNYVSLLCGQEAGSKAHCIEHLKALGGYADEEVMMVGDAPGDLRAAKKNGVLFYPIIPGNEAHSWKTLQQKDLWHFFNGDYKGVYEDSLINTYENLLIAKT